MYSCKNIRQTPIEEFLQITGPVLPQTAQVIKEKESLRHCHNQKGSKEIGKLNVIWYTRWNPGHLNKIWT
jgi:hypothetical protein